jgi:hypothetical protein
MSARARVHAMFRLDEAATAELDLRLDALVAAALHQAADEIDRAQQRLVVKKTVVNILRRRANQTGEKATAETATAAPDFFRAGRTYEYAPLHLVFRCDAVSTHPVTGEPSAVGWVRYHGSSWTSGDYSPAEYADGWLDVTGEVAA